MDFLLKHKLTAAGLVLMIAVAAWYFLAGSSETDAVLSIETPTVPPQAQKLIQSLAVLSTVQLDGAIFSNPSFTTLVDFSLPITVEPVGRENPFSPLSAGEIGSSVSPQATTPPSPSGR